VSSDRAFDHRGHIMTYCASTRFMILNGALLACSSRCHSDTQIYLLEITLIYVISGFRSEVGENCALQGYDAASGGSLVPTFRDFGFLTLEVGTDRLYRNVGNKLQLLAA